MKSITIALVEKMEVRKGEVLVARRLNWRAIALISLLALVILLAFSCGKPSEEEKTSEKRESAEELVKKYPYDKPEVCQGCHGEIFEQWQGTMHSIAFNDPLYLAEAELAGKEAGPEVERFCHTCHGPVAVLRGQVNGYEMADTVAKRGVFCDFCHTIKSLKGIGNGQYVPAPGIVKRGPFKDSVSPYHETAYSELHTKSEFCGICHNVNHPANGLPIEATFTEWKKSPYAKAGIQCQDCHMTPTPGPVKSNPGRAAITGPKRPLIYTHNFVGSNVFMTTFLKAPEKAKLAEERLKAAASLKIKPPSSFVQGKSNKLEVVVTNKGAGHYLPTGLTEVREMWLYLVVKDNRGKVVYESGALDRDGALDYENTSVFRTVLGDKNGKPTVKVWEAESILEDHRVPPKKSLTEVYAVRIPLDAKGPFKVTATLKYRTAPQPLVDKLLGKGKFKVPVVDMVTEQIAVR